MRRIVLLTFALACLPVHAQMVAGAPRVGDPAYWAMQRELNKILLRTSVGEVAITAAATAARVNPWVTALTIGAVVYGLTADTNSSVNPKIDVIPGPDVCFDKRNSLYCTDSQTENGHSVRYFGFIWVSNSESRSAFMSSLALEEHTKLCRFLGDNYWAAGAPAYKVFALGNGVPHLSQTYCGDWSTGSWVPMVQHSTGIKKLWRCGAVETDQYPYSPCTERPYSYPTPTGNPRFVPAYPGFGRDGADPFYRGSPGLDSPGSLSVPSVFTRELLDTSGGVHRQAIQPLPDGGLLIHTRDDYLDASGKRNTVTQTLKIDARGVVTDASLYEGAATNDTSTSPTPGGTTEVKVETCGLPGKPACKIDETGTPTWEDKPATALDTLKSAEAAKRDELMSQVPEPDLGWFGAPPLAECVPFEYPNGMGSINPCGVVGNVRDVMAYLWALVAAWLSFGMIRKAATGGS